MPRTGDNIYKRKDGRWEGRYPIGRKENGRLHYGYIYGKTCLEVRKQLLPLREKAVQSAHFQKVGTMTYQAWIHQWLGTVRETLKPSTFASYAHKLKRYVLPHLGTLSLYQIDAQTMEELVAYWEKATLSAASIKVIMIVVSNTLTAAYKTGLIEQNPCPLVSLPKGTKKKVRALSIREQKQLEQVIAKEHTPFSCATLLAMHTGMRIGEVCALKWTNIQLDQRLLLVEATYQRVPLPLKNQTALHYGSAKSKSAQRVIPLSQKVTDLLRELYQSKKNDYVFSIHDKPVEPRLLTYHFHRLRKQVALEHVHFHQLRHTFATRCLESGADIPSVSALLGHASTKMTLDIYSDSMLEQRIFTIRCMEKALT